jgi:hypothetical protein
MNRPVEHTFGDPPVVSIAPLEECKMVGVEAPIVQDSAVSTEHEQPQKVNKKPKPPKKMTPEEHSTRAKQDYAVSVEGFRKDWRVPLFATARFDAYKQTKKDGDREVLTKMWSDRSEEQLAKCCEALMLRTVSPEECAGLLISEELGNDAPDALEQLKELAGHSSGPVSTVVAAPEPTVTPKVNQEACDFMTLEAPVVKVVSVPVPAVAATVTQQTATPSAQPTPAPIAPATNPVSVKPSPGLFTETNRPDPAHETRVFAEPLPVNPALTAALAGVSNPSPTQGVSIPVPVTLPPVALPSVAEVKQALSTVAAAAPATVIAAATGDVPCESSPQPNNLSPKSD